MPTIHRATSSLILLYITALLLSNCSALSTANDSSARSIATAAATRVPAVASETTSTVTATSSETTTTPPASQTTPQPNSSCTHPYYPLVQSATWIYAPSGTLSKTNVLTQTVSQVSSTALGIKAEISIMGLDAGKVVQEITCTSDGLRFEQFPRVPFWLVDPTANLDTIQSEGVFLLPSDKLTPGATWDAHYRLRVKITDAATQQQFDMYVDKMVHSEVLGSEKVTVSAGSFDALKIKQRIVSSFSLSDPNAQAHAPAPTEQEQNTWFAHDIGMIKMTLIADSVVVPTIELQSYHMP